MDDGTKVVDARIYYPSFRKFVSGDIIKFENSSDTNECFFAQMTYKKVYRNFEKILKKETVKACLPAITGGIDAAVEIYHSFRNHTYQKLARQVVAYKFRRVRNDFWNAPELLRVICLIISTSFV